MISLSCHDTQGTRQTDLGKLSCLPLPSEPCQSEDYERTIWGPYHHVFSVMSDMQQSLR